MIALFHWALKCSKHSVRPLRMRLVAAACPTRGRCNTHVIPESRVTSPQHRDQSGVQSSVHLPRHPYDSTGVCTKPPRAAAYSRSIVRSCDQSQQRRRRGCFRHLATTFRACESNVWKVCLEPLTDMLCCPALGVLVAAYATIYDSVGAGYDLPLACAS